MKRARFTVLFLSLGLLAAFCIDAGRVFSQDKKYAIGDRGPAGGWIFYDKGKVSDGWRYLEVAPEDGYSTEWCSLPKEVQVAKKTAVGTGMKNTQAIRKECNNNTSAVGYCVNLKTGGKNDWFLPSKDELNLIYTNLRLAGIGNLSNGKYWSSTEFEMMTVWIQNFSDGSQEKSMKFIMNYTDGRRIRAVRAFR